MTSSNSKTYNIVLGGIITALSVVIMLLGVLIPIADLVFAALAGILLICTVIELGEKWSLIIYIAVSALSILLLPEKSIAVYYIMFLGQYTITKSFIERINNKTIKWIVKFVVFNICAFIAAVIVIFVLSGSEILSLLWYLVYVVILNVTFVIYDLALDKLILLYKIKWHKLLHKK